MTARRRLFTAWDAVLLAALLIFCGALFRAASAQSNGTTAVVEQNGEEVYRAALSAGQEKTTFRVPGGYNVVIVVEDGKTWFEHSDCPDQICVRSGKLSKSGQTAACLPAGVVLRIEGEAQQNDALTG